MKIETRGGCWTETSMARLMGTVDREIDKGLHREELDGAVEGSSPGTSMRRSLTGPWTGSSLGTFIERSSTGPWMRSSPGTTSIEKEQGKEPGVGGVRSGRGGVAWGRHGGAVASPWLAVEPPGEDEEGSFSWLLEP
jgi:hypothetical protein